MIVEKTKLTRYLTTEITSVSNYRIIIFTNNTAYCFSEHDCWISCQNTGFKNRNSYVTTVCLVRNINYTHTYNYFFQYLKSVMYQLLRVWNVQKIRFLRTWKSEILGGKNSQENFIFDANLAPKVQCPSQYLSSQLFYCCR